MELTSVRSFFRDREQYIGKEVVTGGWVRSIRASKHLDLSLSMTEHFLSRFR